jgi:hypothetical protein
MAKLWNDEDTFVVTEAGQLLRKANEALARVRELHYEYPDTGDCAECNHIYPCPTIKALDGETDGAV